MMGLLTLLLGTSAALWTNAKFPLIIKSRAIYYAEVSTSLFNQTLNQISPMSFAANQQQNETYMFGDMLDQPDVKESVIAIMKKDEVHECCKYWTPLKIQHSK
eukprot:14149142-Ditylum_brightwellii.AAC.2